MPEPERRKGFVRKFIEKRHQRKFGKHLEKKGFENESRELLGYNTRERLRAGTWRPDKSYKLEGKLKEKFAERHYRIGPMKEVVRDKLDAEMINKYHIKRNRELLERSGEEEKERLRVIEKALNQGKGKLNDEERRIFEEKGMYYQRGDPVTASEMRAAVRDYLAEKGAKKKLLRERFGGLFPKRQKYRVVEEQVSAEPEKPSGRKPSSPRKPSGKRREPSSRKKQEKDSERRKRNKERAGRIKELIRENKVTDFAEWHQINTYLSEYFRAEIKQGHKFTAKDISEIEKHLKKEHPRISGKVKLWNVFNKEKQRIKKQELSSVKRKLQSNYQSEGNISVTYMRQLHRNSNTLTLREIKEQAELIQNKLEPGRERKEALEDAKLEKLDLKTRNKLIKEQLRKEKLEAKTLKKKRKIALKAMDKSAKHSESGEVSPEIHEMVKDMNLPKEDLERIKKIVDKRQARREKNKKILKKPGKLFLKGKDEMEDIFLKEGKRGIRTTGRAVNIGENFVKKGRERGTPLEKVMTKAEKGLGEKKPKKKGLIEKLKIWK